MEIQGVEYHEHVLTEADILIEDVIIDENDTDYISSFKIFKTLFLCLRYLAKLYDYYNEDNISLNELYSFS